MDLLYERQVSEDNLHLLLVQQSSALLLRVLRLTGNPAHRVKHPHIVGLCRHQLVEHLGGSLFLTVFRVRIRIRILSKYQYGIKLKYIIIIIIIINATFCKELFYT